MYTRKSSGPRSNPWGTPVETGLSDESETLNMTNCFMLFR